MAAPEKRYDQDESSASSEEDFVNAASATPLPSSRPGSAASTARPSSRTSRTSAGSRSSRRAKVHSSSSSESTDSEEEAELRDELANVDVEAGTVRGAPVEGRVERVMRSITKGSASRSAGQQSYAAVDVGGSRRTKSHRSSRSSRSRGGSSRSYSLGATSAASASAYAPDPLATEKLSKSQRKALAAADPEGAAPTKRKYHWLRIALVMVILIIIIAIVVFFVVRNFTSDNSDDTFKANSTTSAAADRQNATGSAATNSGPSASVSGSLLTDLPGLTDGKATSAPTAATTATFDDGKYHPATTASVLTGALSSASGDASGLLSGTSASVSIGSPTAGQTGDAGHQTDSSNVVPMPTGIAATQSGVQHPSQNHEDGTAHATGKTGAPGEWAPQKTEQPQQQPSSMWWSTPQDQGQGQGQNQDHGQGQGQDQDHGQDHEQQQQHPGQQQAAPSQGGWQSPAAPNASPSGVGTPPYSSSNPSSSPQQQPGNGYYNQGQLPQQPTWPQGPGAGYGGQGAGQPSWNGGQPYGQPQPSQWQQPPGYGGQGQGQYQNGQGAYPYAAAGPIAAGPYIGSGNAPLSSDGSHADLGTVAGGWPPSPQVSGQPQAAVHPFANSTAYKAERPEPFQTYKGNGTWFESSQHVGGCGFATQETDFVVALSNQTWESSRESQQPNARSKFCGAEVLVTNQQTGMSIKAWVTEHCAYCVGENALDLSKAVFEKLTADTGGLDRGVVPLIWGFTGNVSSTEPPKTTAGKGGQTKEDGDADDKDKDHNAKEEGEESDKGWFDGWFGSSDESDHVSE